MTSQPNNIAAGSVGDTPVGIIAGAGRFPFLVAEGAKREGRSVVIVGLRGLADPDLQSLADVFRWFGLGRLGGWIRFLRRHRVHHAVMSPWTRRYASEAARAPCPAPREPSACGPRGACRS